MRSVTQYAKEKRLQIRQAPTSPKDQVEGRCAEKAADRNENQRVRELTMIFEEHQRVRLGADESVQIGGHDGDEPHGAGDPDLCPVARRLRQCCAYRTLS